MLYTYDSYQRVTMVQRYLWLNGIRAEDMCERETYSYDTNPFDATFSQKPSGRLTAVQYGGTRSGCSGTIFTEMYSYTPSGHITAKRLRVNKGNKGNNNADLNASFTYNNEGALSSVTYPNGGPTFTYGFDTMGRPISLADNQTTPVTWVKVLGTRRTTSSHRSRAGMDPYTGRNPERTTRPAR